jgi:sugar lactone lactonase YvrE
MRMTSQRRSALGLVSAAVIAAAQSAGAAGGFTNGQAAAVVLGQPDFVTNAAATTSAGALSNPVGVATDKAGNVWVADKRNYRVVRFTVPLTVGMAASIVIGQPDFTSNGQNNGGRTASSLGGPNSVAVDASGNLWVADGGANGRILRYAPPFANFMAASLVLGMPNFTSVGGGPSQTKVGRSGGGGPTGLAFDSSGNVWVADYDNSRVLRFDAPFTNGQPASIVLGQPDFTSSSAGTPPTASSLNKPESLAVDSAGNLWVADTANSRVLMYRPPFQNGQRASLVVGQALFNSSTAPNPPTAFSLRYPRSTRFDPSGSLWIADTSNRILGYDPPFANGQAAATVLGQADFVSVSAPNPPTASSLRFPFGPVAFSGRYLVVADTGNNRVLAYTPPVVAPTPIEGNIISPPDFPVKVTSEWGCAESLVGICLRREIIRLCVGGNCFGPMPPPTPPICARCHLGAGAAAGAALAVAGMFLFRRRRLSATASG